MGIHGQCSKFPSALESAGRPLDAGRTVWAGCGEAFRAIGLEGPWPTFRGRHKLVTSPSDKAQCPRFCHPKPKQVNARPPLSSRLKLLRILSGLPRSPGAGPEDRSMTWT